MNQSKEIEGNDCRILFKNAYENRYTWGDEFKGYKGSCIWDNGIKVVEGSFLLGKDLKSNVTGIADQEVLKAISSQLWEVAIHRVRRGFEKVHGENTFTAGDINQYGLEVLVGGKNVGDKYRIKNNVVTMVFRHIHGVIVEIYTIETVDTGNGYLSRNYSSQYYDPTSGMPTSGKSLFRDEFKPLKNSSIWVLNSREIEKEEFNSSPYTKEKYSFLDLQEI
ncbi:MULTISPECIES: DUF3386 domain-containing protein [Prochlorococcus]|uniref:DUF3386 domain-containing protein n=1 Tax=Prochlorococcus marinus (strain SARG / CCMP1375 / SS120) TaxID=167539 RepID=Q7VBB6_PROMA|nr:MULTISPECIES: DUF3386 domain-containing protein [Prochlorococcus]AAQ00226.1 Uncharacterized protein Pro_1181 [Prochlorococcus marinus subsp. marinus str. CCMP1375]KGG14027.1 hypothetical protein EV04_0512 [Prochlorococcus marinus str. LG]KGG19159.1 hypothetical protein EV08_1646 [Prochlorococcus marinus str. SS2]KGG23300.1 hypothetical protein EV09_0924 [Prochlorococcus marinus str. SS35]KGG32465.1 hypothetical protein EV10_1580 [Prochlorococcus marinus str. SS51]